MKSEDCWSDSLQENNELCRHQKILILCRHCADDVSHLISWFPMTTCSSLMIRWQTPGRESRAEHDHLLILWTHPGSCLQHFLLSSFRLCSSRLFYRCPDWYQWWSAEVINYFIVLQLNISSHVPPFIDKKMMRSETEQVLSAAESYQILNNKKLIDHNWS